MTPAARVIAASAITRYYVEHATSARLGALLGTIALLPMLRFVVSMFNRPRAAEEGTHPLASIALLGGLMVCVEHFLFCGFLFQAALAPETVGPQVTTAWHWAYASDGAAFITYVTFLLAVGVVALRYQALGRGIGLSALLSRRYSSSICRALSVSSGFLTRFRERSVYTFRSEAFSSGASLQA